MARIESLSMMTSDSAKDYLAELYGAVIENVQKSTIAALIKNTDLSGTPTSGTVEAKRFANAASKDYGTARAASAGSKVKVAPVTIAIDVDKELIEEIEQKDVSLYGVDDVVGRRVASHEKSMERELERAFFAKAVAEGTKATLTGTTAADKLEEIIQKVETVKNDYVDGVDRDMISVTLDTATYGEVRSFLDTNTNNANVDTGAKEFAMFHGVRIFSSVYLPTGTKYVAQADGSIAQPILTTIATPEKIQLSNAYSFGLFYDYGTKAVTPDLIFTA